ncbi:MAG: phosphodiester glycosidase family protein [Anaerolineae bacterium]|nr:phosphodiester glycosidase family protein [Candidatus Roseilinea sp.]MDW8449234.1 phosphodiester glycosidase family protein [Anaerolineae bacterium]
MRFLRAIGAAALIGLSAACSDAPAVPAVSPTILPSPVIYPTQPAVVTNTPVPTATPLAYDGRWRTLAPAIELMLLQGRSNGADELLMVARVDLRRAALRVLYDPQTPRTLRDWQLAAGADLVINGGFFDEANRATGLLIADGRAFGRSYRGFGGMFALREGKPSLQWLRTHPYRFDPAIEQAVQSFPMLVVDAQRVEGISDNGQRNRRSFIALDREGYVLLGVTQMAQWTLTDLAGFLAASPELRVVDALNLDGGGSSGLWVDSSLSGFSMNSFEPVPSAIAIFSQRRTG